MVIFSSIPSYELWKEYLWCLRWDSKIWWLIVILAFNLLAIIQLTTIQIVIRYLQLNLDLLIYQESFFNGFSWIKSSYVTHVLFFVGRRNFKLQKEISLSTIKTWAISLCNYFSDWLIILTYYNCQLMKQRWVFALTKIKKWTPRLARKKI